MFGVDGIAGRGEVGFKKKIVLLSNYSFCLKYYNYCTFKGFVTFCELEINCLFLKLKNWHNG